MATLTARISYDIVDLDIALQKTTYYREVRIMECAQDPRYGLLIDELMKLLCEKDSLRSKISSGMNLKYHVYSPDEDQSRLDRIVRTIKQIARRHAELVRLVMRKFTLQKEADRTPSGNAGYLKQVQSLNELKDVQEALDELVAV